MIIGLLEPKWFIMNQDNNYNEGAINRSTRFALTITVM